MKEYKKCETALNGGNSAVFESVKKIISDVREDGDKALAMYSEKFGSAPLASFRVPQEEIDKAYENISDELRSAIEYASDNIRHFAELQKESLTPVEARETAPGVFLGHRIIPVDSCCCYIPGGNHPLFSTALMLAIPAAAAGVPRVCAAVPPMKGSTLPHPATLAALKTAGASEVYCIGGAQAIAAFAYGTESIKPVSMIVGPGNKYVTEAKRQVYGQVGIDFIAGPSEVLIIADESANPKIIAADILAQSEHDADAAGILITTSEHIAAETETEVERQLMALETRDTASLSWRNNGRIIVADSLDEAAEIANQAAPEHLEINTADPDCLVPKLRNFGSLFIGECSAEVFGDYSAGTNHTLPTMKAARYTGGVSVMTFLKVCTCQKITKEGVLNLAPSAAAMARSEGLAAHEKAALIRMKQ